MILTGGCSSNLCIQHKLERGDGDMMPFLDEKSSRIKWTLPPIYAFVFLRPKLSIHNASLSRINRLELNISY